jgi:hypothetical protein
MELSDLEVPQNRSIEIKVCSDGICQNMSKQSRFHRHDQAMAVRMDGTTVVNRHSDRTVSDISNCSEPASQETYYVECDRMTWPRWR